MIDEKTSYQHWLSSPEPTALTTLDRRGNWLWHATRVGDPNLPAAETTRTLPTGVPAGTGGKANEYGRVQLVAAGQPIDHELVCDAAGNLVRVDVVGDLNCDGEVTFDDLDAFMLALTDPSGYAQAHPDCRLLLGDVDGDGQLTFDDIDYWVALIGVSAVAADRYEYDHENRLTAVRGPGGVLKLRIWYDALGRRILSETYDASGDPVTTTRHIYDGLATIVEFEDEGGAPADWTLAREFIWGDRFPEPLVLIDHTAAGDAPAGLAENLYYVHDALGSVVGLTNDPAALAALDPNYPGAGGSGGGVGGTTGILPALVERYDYGPYGATYIACRDPNTYDDVGETRDPNVLTDPAAWQPCESSRFGNPLLWTAQRYDAGVRLYHFLFRTYSPTLGRWLQCDPAGYVDGVSLYEAALSSPAVAVDPFGLDAWIAADGLHWKVCIGDRLGVYQCFTFGVEGNAWNHLWGIFGYPTGVVSDDYPGGQIIRFKRVTPEQDAALLRGLWELYGKRYVYSPSFQCRRWSEMVWDALVDPIPGEICDPPSGYEPSPPRCTARIVNRVEQHNDYDKHDHKHDALWGLPMAVNRSGGPTRSLVPLCLLATALLFVQWNALLLVAKSTDEIRAGRRSVPDALNAIGVVWAVTTVLASCIDSVKGLTGYWRRRAVFKVCIASGLALALLGAACVLRPGASLAVLISSTNFGVLGAAWLALLWRIGGDRCAAQG
ncbi:MAG: hypothetical protein IPM13_09055 [Phycisphaerales bacterium]|nr:hypothetical protein [Phycisphaerales bacterium]